jgi:hypothetical protein
MRVRGGSLAIRPDISRRMFDGDRQRVGSLGLLCFAAISCALPVAASPAPFLQVAPLASTA